MTIAITIINANIEAERGVDGEGDAVCEGDSVVDGEFEGAENVIELYFSLKTVG